MLENYFPVLLFIGIALVMGIAPLVLGMLAGPNRPDEKNFHLTNAASRLSKTRA